MNISESQRVVQNAMRKLQQGKLQAAAKAAQAGAKKFPKNQDLHGLAATALAQAGDHKAAAKAYSNLYKLAPNSIKVRMSFGISLVHAERFDVALKLADEWRVAEPENPSFRYLKALAAIGLREFDIAEEETTKALSVKPDMERSLAIRGLARFELGRFEKSLDDFQRANELAPDNLETLLNIGLCHSSLYQNEEATKTFQKCVDLFPQDIAVRTNLATSLEASGELQRALNEHRAILDLSPENWWSISRIVELNSEEQNQDFEAYVRKHLRKVSKNSLDEVTAAMAMATLLSKIDNWPEAEKFFRRSNHLQAASKPYDPETAEARLAETLALFPAKHKFRPGGDTELPRPIFIIGQPRSGTTLMEMMITSHPDVIGLGEYGAIEDVANSAMAEGVSDPAQHAEAYCSELPESVHNYKALVDKMPGNYRYVGFLAEAFPESKFIHIERDPREVAFSMWKRHLAGDLNTYTSDFVWMAHAANIYRRYMLRWQKLYSPSILTVNYRDLVHDLETVSRKIAGFCDLDWQVSMMEPEQNKATVLTASIVQVRQKVHTNSIGSWEKHASLLQPFIENLDATLWPDIR